MSSACPLPPQYQVVHVLHILSHLSSTLCSKPAVHVLGHCPFQAGIELTQDNNITIRKCLAHSKTDDRGTFFLFIILIWTHTECLNWKAKNTHPPATLVASCLTTTIGTKPKHERVREQAKHRDHQPSGGNRNE